MKDTVQTTAPVRRAVLAAAAAGVLVLGGLVGAIYLDEAIDDSTTSFVAGGGLWGGWRSDGCGPRRRGPRPVSTHRKPAPGRYHSHSRTPPAEAEGHVCCDRSRRLLTNSEPASGDTCSRSVRSLGSVASP